MLVSLLVGFIDSGLCINVAWEVIANKEVITTPKSRVPFEGIQERSIVVGAKSTTPDKLLGFFKAWVWFELFIVLTKKLIIGHLTVRIISMKQQCYKFDLAFYRPANLILSA
jgi:hypothetical protein